MLNIVNEYYTYAKTMEMNRLENIKAVFKEFMEKFSKVSYISTFEIAKMFEEEISVGYPNNMQ